MAFSQSTFTASEGDGIVPVCAELLIGDLETDISLFVDALHLESTTGMLFAHLISVCIYSGYCQWICCAYISLNCKVSRSSKFRLTDDNI